MCQSFKVATPTPARARFSISQPPSCMKTRIHTYIRHDKIRNRYNSRYCLFLWSLLWSQRCHCKLQRSPGGGWLLQACDWLSTGDSYECNSNGGTSLSTIMLMMNGLGVQESYFWSAKQRAWSVTERSLCGRSDLLDFLWLNWSLSRGGVISRLWWDFTCETGGGIGLLWLPCLRLQALPS